MFHVINFQSRPDYTAFNVDDSAAGLTLYTHDEVPLVATPGSELCIIRDNKISRIIPLTDWNMWYDDAFCLSAVRSSGMALYFVKRKTLKICLAAVAQQPWALRFVPNEIYEECAGSINFE